MSLPDEFVEGILQHIDPNYNAQQAHEYYLRSRRLKGRQPSVQRILTPRSNGKVVIPIKVIRKGRLPVTSVVKQRQTAVNLRVAGLQKKLRNLKTVLEDLVKKAKEKEGRKDSKTKSGTTRDKSDLTPQQKRETAKRSKETYEKNKKLKGPVEKNPETVEEVRAKIRKIQEELKAAIVQSRRISSSTSKTVIGR